MKRPESFTIERAWSMLPTMDISQEWLAKKEAGELPEGLAGIAGSMTSTPSDVEMTEEEARWVLHLYETHSMRAVAHEVFGDDNQIFGSDIIDIARERLT